MNLSASRTGEGLEEIVRSARHIQNITKRLLVVKGKSCITAQPTSIVDPDGSRFRLALRFRQQLISIGVSDASSPDHSKVFCEGTSPSAAS
jgi:hypothetical protein